MAEVPHERPGSSVRPVDFSELLERLELGIGQAARLCGVSIRQLSYWTDKGVIKPIERGSSRTYDYPALSSRNDVPHARPPALHPPGNFG